jgi:hypothetical protein
VELFEFYANGFTVLDRRHVDRFRFRMAAADTLVVQTLC